MLRSMKDFPCKVFNDANVKVSKISLYDIFINMYLQEAQAIVKDTGVTYLNLCSWDGFDEMLACIGTPTTYFVDSHGKLLGEPVLGAYPEKYKEFMEEYLSKAE